MTNFSFLACLEVGCSGVGCIGVGWGVVVEAHFSVQLKPKPS